MVAAMSVHGQWVEFYYSSLDITIFSAHITCAIITLATHKLQIKPKLRELDENRRWKIFVSCWRNWKKAQKCFVRLVSLINRTEKLSCSVWLTSVVSSASIENHLHWEISDSICFCMASPVKDIVWFRTLHPRYEALWAAFKKRSDVCLSTVSPVVLRQL